MTRSLMKMQRSVTVQSIELVIHNFRFNISVLDVKKKSKRAFTKTTFAFKYQLEKF